MAILTMKPNKSNDMELKSRMTVEEMAAHLTEHTGKLANRAKWVTPCINRCEMAKYATSMSIPQ